MSESNNRQPSASRPPLAETLVGSPSATRTGVTLDHPRRFCPLGGMVGSRESQWNQRTASVLHQRLRALGTIFVVASLFVHSREFFVDVGFSVTFPLIVVGVIAVAVAYLYVEKDPPLIKLRVFEVLVFVLPIASLVHIDKQLMLQSAAAGDSGLVLMNWYRFILHMFIVIAAYTLFIPAGWKRTLVVTTPIALVPVGFLGLWMRGYPEVAAAVNEAMTAEIFTGGVMLLAMLVAFAVYGTYIIDASRHQVAAAGFAGQYTLEKKLGKGGMGEVWLARHSMLTRPAAIKVIRPEVLAEGNGKDADEIPTVMKRFEREAQATASLTSEHTVDLYDFGTAADGSFYYVMQYLDGIDLETLVDEHGPVPVERAVHLVTQAAESLADAHAHGLIHRDVKPANIFTTRMGTHHDFVKVLDFGLVKETRSDFEATQLTQQGVTSGTPAYMSPEIALAKDDVDARADVYALACVAYWLATGHYVFDADSPMAMVVEHVKSEPVAPSRRTELPVPAEFDEVILKALAKNPADRYQDMTEFAEALRQVPVPEPWTEKAAADWWTLHEVGDVRHDRSLIAATH